MAEEGALAGGTGAGEGTTAGSAAPPIHRQPRLSLWRALIYSSGNFGSGVFFAFNNFILSLYLLGLGASPVLMGLLSSTRSVEGAVIQPLVGAWSDRTWTPRLGRRRPFIVGFVPLSALFVVATAFVPRARGLAGGLGLSPAAFTLIVGSIGVFLFSVTFNVMYDPYQALLPDITPAGQRGHVNGVFQMLGAAGQMAVLLFSVFLFNAVSSDRAFFALFLLTGAALALFFVPTVVGVPEPRRLVDVPLRRRHRLGDYVDALSGEREVQLYFAVQFFLWFGINAITPFLTPYAEKVIGLKASGAILLSFILLASTAVFNWPFGALADRLGLKRVFLAGMILMAGASVAGIFIRQPILLYGVLFLAGVGNAAQTGSSYPLLTRLVRPDRMGLYTGLLSTITSIAAPASALIAGLLIERLGYAFMFPFVAAMFLLSLVPLALLNVRAGEAKVNAELRSEAQQAVAAA